MFKYGKRLYLSKFYNCIAGTTSDQYNTSFSALLVCTYIINTLDAIEIDIFKPSRKSFQ